MKDVRMKGMTETKKIKSCWKAYWLKQITGKENCVKRKKFPSNIFFSQNCLQKHIFQK